MVRWWWFDHLEPETPQARENHIEIHGYNTALNAWPRSPRTTTNPS